MKENYREVLELFVELAMACHEESVLQKKKSELVQQQIEEISTEVRGLQIEMQRLLRILREEDGN